MYNEKCEKHVILTNKTIIETIYYFRFEYKILIMIFTKTFFLKLFKVYLSAACLLARDYIIDTLLLDIFDSLQYNMKCIPNSRLIRLTSNIRNDFLW